MRLLSRMQIPGQGLSSKLNYGLYKAGSMKRMKGLAPQIKLLRNAYLAPRRQPLPPQNIPVFQGGQPPNPQNVPRCRREAPNPQNVQSPAASM
ncbi:hypothetical protein F2P81_007532 [Scophthalmus maximus]|uniref:Uncharacterized protein n=1 Tax=Scophthalmus maximus TaxID=52904 RepID=A0A6A4SZZ6_SCOMX|nr:hypothetical protein F2P81_007532 [Scophthalmus maximus]